MLTYFRVNEAEMTDKLVRVSSQTWQKLRTVAFYQNTRIKTVLDCIVNEKIR